jgi:hypothetical protein
MNNDDMDDAQFEAFLKGEGELSQRLQALAQPSPSAELDAAILARATVDVARQTRPAAANDAGSAPAPQLARNLSWRWRVPAGIAATVLCGVFVHQSWQADKASRAGKLAVAEAPPEVLMIQTPTTPAPMAPPAEVQVQMDSRAAPMAAPKSVAAPAAVAQAPAPPPAPVITQDYEMRAADKMEKESLARAQRSAPATAQGAAAELYRSRIGTDNNAQARLKAAADDPAAIQLALIEARLKAGLQREALEEWTRFRAAYPDYPVSQATQDQIDAIKP